MATLLNKDLKRETTITNGDNRPLVITLTEKQTIELQPKGLKGDNGIVSLEIKNLYEDVVQANGKPNIIRGYDSGNDLISLNELRSHNAIADMDLETKTKFERIILDLINANK